MNEKKDTYPLEDDGSFSSIESHYESTEQRVIHGFDPIIEKRLLRKLDFCLVPFVTIMYLFASLDRTNIGNARLGSFEVDLNFQGNDFHLALMVFYIGYLACQIPSNLVLKLTTPSLWIGITTIIWGASSTSIAATNNLAGVIAARFFLGCAESGIGPCVPLLLSFWYQRHEMASRVSIFLTASSLAGCFGGIWAYLIMNHLDQFQGIASWRWMFIIEGIPTILLGILCLLFLPNYPETASERWLTPDEKQVAIQRGELEGKNNKDDTVDWQQVYGALLDYKTWLVAFINGGTGLCHASFNIFLPTIVRSMGFQALQAQLFSVPPYVVGCISLLVSCWLSDRIRQRAWLIVGCSLISVIGYTLLLIGSHVGLQYTGVILVSGGVSPALALGISWLSNNQFGHTRRGVSLSSANMVAQVFALLGTQIYRDSDAPNYRIGHGICLGLTVVSIALACLLRYLLVRENNRRDNRFGPPTAHKMDLAALPGNDGHIDFNQFRFIL